VFVVETYLQEYPEYHAPSKAGQYTMSERMLMPLSAGILTRNLGIPLIVVCNKVSSCERREGSVGS
jgi:hypothetical protein